MELVLFQDSLWFVAAVFWLLAGLLVRWPGTQSPRSGLAMWGWVTLCALHAGAALIHLLNFDSGIADRLIRFDWIAGGMQVGALLLALWRGLLGSWIPAGPRRGIFLGLLTAQSVLWPAAAIALGIAAPLLQTDFLPWGVFRSSLSVVAGGLALSVVWRAQLAPSRRRELAPLWLSFALLLGIGLAELLAAQSRERSAEAVVVRAQSLALALDEEALAALKIDEHTHESAPFKILRAQLLRLRRANPDAAYLYLMALHDEHAIYPVSGAEFYYSDISGSEERIPEQDVPFEIGPKADAFHHQLFAAKAATLWQFDREPSFYGVLLSTYAPIFVSPESTPRYVLGLDVRSPAFLISARHARRLAQALTLAGIAAVLLFLRYQIDAEKAEADRLARTEADRRERTRNEFLGMISHELRTPVHAILARTGALRQGSPVEQTALELDTLAGDLQRLVEDLLQASALQGPSFRLQLRRCRLPAVLREIARTAERDAVVKGLTFTTAFSPRIPAIVRTDELRLRQILVNLLSNAVKYTMTGEVRFTADLVDTDQSTLGEHRLRFTVSDTGPGLAATAQARIFEPFYRARETAWQAGMGLGLAVARDLSERLNGRLTFAPAKPRGATFSVELPFTIETSTSTAPMPVNNPRIVLIVEDHPSLRLHLAEQIEKLGWTALTADTVAAAEAHWQDSPPSVVFVDQQLPDGTGAEWLAKQVTKNGPRPWIIGMSASLDPKIAEALLAAGADDFLYKPVSQTALREALELRAPTQFPAATRAVPLEAVDAAIAAGDWAAAGRAAHFLINHVIALHGTSELLAAARKMETAIHEQHVAEIEIARRELLAASSPL